MTQNANSLPEQEGLLPLPIPVPPSLAGALGYTGEARYLAIWWEAADDKAMWSDSRTTSDGWWHGFLTYVQHPRVEPYLAPYGLGSSEEPAVYYLLLDLVITGAYHLGYDQFREAGIGQPEIGNVIISVPMLATANPAGSILTHASMHLAATIYSYETDVFLPPQTEAP